MNFKRLSGKARELVDKRGGTESLKQDAEELRKIAKGPGSFKDKAKSAAGALKRPGAGGGPGAGDEAQTAAATPDPTHDVEQDTRARGSGSGL